MNSHHPMKSLPQPYFQARLKILYHPDGLRICAGREGPENFTSSMSKVTLNSLRDPSTEMKKLPNF